MISLIDGDSISFMLGWVHREHQDKDLMYQSIDAFLENIFILTGADMYYGALAGDRPCFRYDIYKVKPYKGTRTELQDHMVFWKPIIVQYLKDQWKFDYCTSVVTPLEADDLVYTAALSLKAEGIDHCICSPDKDLKQITGTHFDYRTNEFCTVQEYQSHYNFFRLMIEGDTVDNIAGIPGMGEKKAQEKLNPLLKLEADHIAYENLVRDMYYKHFGRYYGEIIYTETKKTISLLWDRERKIEIHTVPQKAHPFETMNQTTD